MKTELKNLVNLAMSNKDIFWYIALAILFLLIGFYIFLRKTRDSNKKTSLTVKILYYVAAPLYVLYKVVDHYPMNGPLIFILVILLLIPLFGLWLFGQLNKTARLQEVPEWTAKEFIEYVFSSSSAKKEMRIRRLQLVSKAAEERMTPPQTRRARRVKN